MFGLARIAQNVQRVCCESANSYDKAGLLTLAEKCHLTTGREFDFIHKMAFDAFSDQTAMACALTFLNGCKIQKYSFLPHLPNPQTPKPRLNISKVF